MGMWSTLTAGRVVKVERHSVLFYNAGAIPSYSRRHPRRPIVPLANPLAFRTTTSRTITMITMYLLPRQRLCVGAVPMCPAWYVTQIRVPLMTFPSWRQRVPRFYDQLGDWMTRWVSCCRKRERETWCTWCLYTHVTRICFAKSTTARHKAMCWSES